MSHQRSAVSLPPRRTNTLDDEVTTTQPRGAHDDEIAHSEDRSPPSLPSSPEEVAKELISFLSQLSPFRIRSERDAP
jgi:hypothetical protein